MNQIFDGEQWVKSAGLGWVKWVSDFMFYPVLVAAFFALHACFFLVLALMAQLSARLFIKQSLSYSQACRLFIVSASPTVFLLFTSLALNLKNSFIGPILLVLMMLYFSFAVFTFKQEGNQIARF